MSPFAALALYPLWSVAFAVGFTAARLARRTGFGLLLVCGSLGVWVSALILLESGVAAWAERLVPAGMLMAGAFVHAASEMAEVRSWRAARIAWLLSAGVTAIGLFAPRLLYGAGAKGAGPLFLPLAIASVVATGCVKLWLLRLVRLAPDARERRRRLALLLANVFGALGGGGAITLHITGVGPIGIAAPFLLGSVVTAAYAVWHTELGRDRELVEQGFVLALTMAALTAPALLALFVALPALTPGHAPLSAWGLLVVFLVALVAEPFRALVADRILATVFERPIAVRAMVQESERHAERADHAERLAELGRIASGVAHEIRNPLGIVLAEAKLLERAGADVESVEAIRTQVARASAFVDDLLRFARPRPLEISTVDVHAAVREGAAHATQALEGGAARLEVPGGEGPIVEADRAAVADVVRNLLTNALIATEGLPDGRVRVRVEEQGPTVVLTVEDNGPGVPRELEPRLFTAFVTGRGRDAKHPGTGLGLAVSSRLAERHGATLAHERPEAGGARFVVRWPKTPSPGT